MIKQSLVPEGDPTDEEEITFNDQLSINDTSSIGPECETEVATCKEHFEQPDPNNFSERKVGDAVL